MFKFLSVAHNIDNLKTGLERHVYEPTKEELDTIWAECDAWDRDYRAQYRFWGHNGMTGVNQLYPSLITGGAATVLGIIARASLLEEEDGVMEDSAETKLQRKIPVDLQLSFANCGQLCEFAYVIDLDKEVFEVYGGPRTYHGCFEPKHDGHRFKDVGDEDESVPSFICSFEFRSIYLMESSEEFFDKIRQAVIERDVRTEESDLIAESNVNEADGLDEGKEAAEGSVRGNP